MPEAHLLGIADVNLLAARRLASELGGPPVFGSLDEMLAAPGLQAVLIATSSNSHLEAIQTAAAAGRDILCEKIIVDDAWMPGPNEMLDWMVEIGFEGTELGPPGFLGNGVGGCGPAGEPRLPAPVRDLSSRRTQLDQGVRGFGWVTPSTSIASTRSS